jgi:hypothetical protein
VRAITRLNASVQAEIAQIIQKVSPDIPEPVTEVLTIGRSSKNSAQKQALINTVMLLSPLKTSNSSSRVAMVLSSRKTKA